MNDSQGNYKQRRIDPNLEKMMREAPILQGKVEKDLQPMVVDDRNVFKTFEPGRNFVALELFIIEETEGGIILPNGAEDPCNAMTARVVAVGPDCKQFKEGDIIIGTPGTQMIPIAHGGSGRVYLVEERQLLGKSLVQTGAPPRSRPAQSGDVPDARDHQEDPLPPNMRPNS